MKDYYLILGVSPGESPQGVRKAFRDLAREHHPDLAGAAGTPMFRDVVEAYRVLSDPEQRRSYDDRRAARHPPPRRMRVRPDPLGPRGRALEPIDLIGRPESIHPSVGALLDRIRRNFVGAAPAKAERPEPLLCDIVLEPFEARRGGTLPIRIPVAQPCPACHATGGVAGFACRHCDGSGSAPRELVVPIEVPPGSRAGTIIDVSLAAWGLRNLWLRARIGILP